MSAAAPSVSRLNLTLNDLPKSYHLASDIHTATDSLREFERRTTSGIDTIDTEIRAYPSPADAGIDLVPFGDMLVLSKVLGVRVTVLPFGTVGTKHLLYQIERSTDHGRITQYALYFQQDAYDVMVEIGGSSGTLNARQVLPLARLLDARVRLS